MNACVYCDPGGEAVVRKAILGTFLWLLREGAERPSRRRSTQQCDAIAPPHDQPQTPGSEHLNGEIQGSKRTLGRAP